MAAEQSERPRARAFWSGTISFGLVSIPVDLYAAVRPRRVPLRMLGPNGRPLARRYVCPQDGRELAGDDIVRGYPSGEDDFIVVTDDELEALEPQKSRDIDLRRFVPRDEIDPILLGRPYLLAPAGQSAKAYHLLAETMERSGRAGIATFVMRGREYLVAILAEGGLIRAETLRFVDEVRDPEDVGLPEVQEAPARRREQMEAAIEDLERDELDEDLLRDESAAELLSLAERKRSEDRDVIEVPEVLPEEEGGEVIDIMSMLKERLGVARAERSSAPERGLADKSKQELYEEARRLEIPGRSRMSKEELIEAIRLSA